MAIPDGEWTTCWKCDTQYFLPRALHDAARASSKISLFCPYGHSAHFPDGATKADIQRQRAERAEQQVEYQCQMRLAAERETAAALRSAAAQKGQVTRLKNRASKGVCPCCNRSFTNLRRHMNSKHPNFVEPPELKVVAGGSK